jgi:integrase
MSIEKVARESGVVWRVRWRQNGRNRAKTFSTHKDARSFDGDVHRRKRLDDLAALDAGKETLAEFAREWWELHAETLARSTQEVYATVLDRYIVPRLGSLRLREIRPQIVERFKRDLATAGVGAASARKTLTVLQGILQRAVEWERITSNPAAVVRKPPVRRERQVQVLGPATVERLRARLAQRDAVLVSVLAYAGLRPGEALALRWRHIGQRTITVEQAVSFGEMKNTKTNSSRTVRLLAPLAHDLAEWRMAQGRPGNDELLFPRPDGKPWTRDDWSNWRNRCFVPTLRALGVTGVRPYDLRHSFCSLLIHEGQSAVEVAAQAGHAPTMTLNTYAHVFEELKGGARLDAEAQIRAARAAHVPVSYPKTVGSGLSSQQKACKYSVGDPGLEPGTSSLSEKRSNRLS